MSPNLKLIVYTHINVFQLITFLSFDFAKSVRFWCVVHTEAHRHTQPSLAKHTAAIFFLVSLGGLWVGFGPPAVCFRPDGTSHCKFCHF